MQKLSFAAQADEYAALAARAATAEERDVLLSMEMAMRKLADADRRVREVRERNAPVHKDATPHANRPHPLRRRTVETA